MYCLQCNDSLSPEFSVVVMQWLHFQTYRALNYLIRQFSVKKDKSNQLRILLNTRKSPTEVMTVLEHAGSTFVWFPP